ncbi:MAG TPA: TRAM domain-containing protein [Actinomycetes bacterium]|nr:TRAM domain-containing protein [Actinomycetes bacterium]
MADRLPRRRRVPQPVVEVLRLCIVLAGAALGYQAAGIFPGPVGSLGPVALGVIIGSGLGYALGGVLGRSTVHAMSRTEQVLRGVPAEQIVAGFFGALLGLLGGAAVAWPVFLIGHAAVAVPLFVFVLLATAMLGYRIGALRRESMIAMFGPGAGMAPAAATTSSVLPRLVDSSVAIDGRIVEVVRAGFLGGRMIVIKPVLDELQGLADAHDDLRRAKGRRGLEILEALRREPSVELEVVDDLAVAVPDVDAKLVRTALDTGWALLTLDSNLARSAALAGVRVLNLHALTLAMRPSVAAGDEVNVLLTKAGKEAGQAVGYLDDGTMVVVERAREAVGQDALVQVTSVLTTANGRMVFARPVLLDGHPVPGR